MALTLGASVDPATTLSALLDLVYANRSAALTAAAAIFTALEPNRIVVSWPGIGTGEDVVYLVLTARPATPEIIAL